MNKVSTMDLSAHLLNLKSYAVQLYDTAQRFLDGYLTMVGINDKGAKIASSYFPQSFIFQRGDDEIAASGRTTYHLPEAIRIEINRAAAGFDPLLPSLVDEINRANELGEEYSPLDTLIADSLKAHYKNMNTSETQPQPTY